MFMKNSVLYCAAFIMPSGASSKLDISIAH
jgi:hypothetical protein